MRAFGPDGHAEARNECGDRLSFSVHVKDGRVATVRVEAEGCAATIACAEAARRLATGRSLVEARRAVTPEAVAAAVGGLPVSERHCAVFAADTMVRAIDEAIGTSRDPWRKIYRHWP